LFMRWPCLNMDRADTRAALQRQCDSGKDLITAQVLENAATR